MARPKNSDAGARARTPILPAAQELALARNYEARTNKAIPRRTGATRPMNISLEDIQAAATLVDRSSVISPMVPLGGLSRAQAAEARSYSDEDGGWDEYYEASQSGYDYENLAGRSAYTGTTTADNAAKIFGKNNPIPTRDPAPISLQPTATIDANRPRTVAAGYDEDRRVLTVVFRDGTFYNYYQVSPQEWEGFKNAPSKGRYIGTKSPKYPGFLNSKPRGTANMSRTSLQSRESLYRISRTAQWVYDGSVFAQYDRTQ